MKKVIFIFLTGVLSLTSEAQVIFKIIASNGINSVKTSSGQIEKALVGVKISQGDMISIGDKSYLAIVHLISGKSLEIKEKGTYKAEVLAGQISATKSDMIKKYSEYVVSQLTNVNQSDPNYMKNMKVTGSVDRGAGAELGVVRVIAPYRTNFLEPVIGLKWYKNPLATTYVVHIRDLYDETIHTAETQDTLFTIDMIKMNFHHKGAFVYNVSVKDRPEIKSVNHAVVLLDTKKDKEVLEGFKNIKLDVSDDNAINNLILASFCEQNKLYYEAMKYYAKAVKLEPEVPEYAYMYKRMLNEIGMRDLYSNAVVSVGQ